jgi:hypothetical protein
LTSFTEVSEPHSDIRYRNSGLECYPMQKGQSVCQLL